MNLGLHGGRIGGIFITGIFTLSVGEFLTFRTGIPSGLGALYSKSFKMNFFWRQYMRSKVNIVSFLFCYCAQVHRVNEVEPRSAG